MKLSKPIIILTLAFVALGQGISSAFINPNHLQLSGRLNRLGVKQSTPSQDGQNAAGNFEVQKLSEGIYAVIRKDLHPTMIVPGHGPVLRDDAYVKQLAKLFISVKQQTEAAASRGETLEQVRKSINLDEFRKQFTGDSKVRKIAFNMYVAGPAIAAAFREATAKK